MSSQPSPHKAGPHEAADRWPRLRLRRLAAGSAALLLAAALVLTDPIGRSEISEVKVTERARSEAATAVTALRTGDLAVLGEQLMLNRADPLFSYYFTREVTPRDLGDTVASAGVPEQPSPATAGLGASAYERMLNNLAATLALATRGTGNLALPRSWSDDFATYTTNPELLHPDQVEAGEQRINQDLANRQNLLLVLSRGRWSTGFLQVITTAFWELEHDPSGNADPWPGPSADGSRYAAAPQGTYLTDGMVALMAALTANPEASGWAFTDFQPGTTTIRYDGADHSLGLFSHYLFFERSYHESSDTGRESSGITASQTALMSAIQATGGSHDVGTAGPQADAYVLQGLQQAAAAEDAAQDESDDQPWYRKAGQTLKDWGTWLNTHSRTVLDTVAAVPVLGTPADVAGAVWSGVERDWANAGLSLVGILPVVGDTVKLTAKVTKNGLKVADSTGDDDGESIELATNTGGLSVDASNLGDGTFLFSDPEEYLEALSKPVPYVTYAYGETAYELAPEGLSLTHISGPAKGVIERNLLADSPSPAGAPQFIASADARLQAQLRERQGLATYAAEQRAFVNREQVLARVSGVASGRFFDGLALKPDGTYEGIEVQDSGGRSISQAAFDELVTDDNAAKAVLDGRLIRITSTHIVYVDD